MFQFPITLTSKRVRNGRKLRYQYVNNLYQKYNKMEGITTNALPTPENSAAESSENEGALERKRNRIRRRLKSIAGESYSDSESDEELNDTGAQDDEEADQERSFFKKYEKPQESFEKWQTESRKRVPIRRTKVSFTKYQRMCKSAKRKMANALELASRHNRIYLQTVSEGLEMVEPVDGKPETYQMKHISVLNNLLHVQIYRGNWAAAYKCFALLIRIPEVDIRNVWGIGNQVLHAKESAKYLEFLEWMSNVYSSRTTYPEDINFRTAPVFTKGSRTHVPKFVTTWLWEALIQYTRESFEINGDYRPENDKLQELIDKISEMLLAPPYMEDSEIWFIYSLCHMVKADILSNKFDSHLVGSARDIASNQVIQHIQKTKSCLQTCITKDDFVYPKRHIERQLETFEDRLHIDDTDSKSMERDTDEMNEELDTQSIPSEYAYQSDLSGRSSST
ncbi:hypothetical protein HG537_0G04360 [Torulaspora globosa]|uniref:RNA polymerase I-specific transcription initiation factor RRN11 n=1 Tax=Torulaspora globosa TaxID=48254 RepID=A0A7H9HXS6_9SACH|nr:hypothetical protein HG537_0G04360 [Torulaspora sp. CBS 2947]